MGCHFKALGDESRRKILTILGKGNTTSGDIAKRFNISQPTISNHLKILKEAGLVKEKKIKQNRIYSLNKERVQKVIDILQDLV